MDALSSRVSDEQVKVMKSRVTPWIPADATTGLRQMCRPEAHKHARHVRLQTQPARVRVLPPRALSNTLIRSTFLAEFLSAVHFSADLL